MAKNTAEKYSPISIQAISQIHGQDDFVEFLRTELEWPIPLHIDRLEDVSIPHDLQRDFGFSQAKDRIQVSRLLNLDEDQPWGIFLFEFKTRRPYLSHLRQLLRKLSSRRTLQRGDPIWDRNDLLFICTHDGVPGDPAGGWKEYQFVHFSGERPESAVISSFGWKGPDDRFLHTLCKHNLPRLRMPDPAPDGSFSADDWRSQWRDAFNIKPVTDEFYATLKEVFHAVESGITGLQGEDRRAFTELMINRLIFLKFVEKKGWLNNDRDYLFHHFQKFSGERYWKDFLYHLFFEGLNTDPTQRPAEASWVLGDVPYLNAELFSLSEQWNDSQVEVEGRSLDLLFDKLLNPYNFTVAETSPLEVEVAFNQDLLGYAYEELIADQHGQGAYYTHPTEVNLMCRESLRAYLEERCPQVEKELIARLVYGELSVTVGGTDLTPAHAVDLYSALHDVTICDPAIGSGTFPVAMVKHLFSCLRSLGQILIEYAPFRELIDQAALTDWRKGYELKLHIIERSIYGCDIDYFAVQIAKLRFWIELMVECDQPVPLPNFDFKLLVGDALVSTVGSDNNGEPISLEEMWGHPTKPRGQVSLSADLARKFAEKKKNYYGVQDPKERVILQKALHDDREQLIRQALQFSRPARQRTDRHVLWQIDFAEIFQGDRPGFDIIIANPPYLRNELIDTTFRDMSIVSSAKMLREMYGRMYRIDIPGKADLYVFFFLRGLMLLKRTNGILCFICSNSWLDVDYGSTLQYCFSKENHIEFILDSKMTRSFENADVNTTINLMKTQGETETRDDLASFIMYKESYETFNFSDMIRDNPQNSSNDTLQYHIVRITHQKLINEYRDGIENKKWGARFLRAPKIYQDLLFNSERKFLELQEIAQVGTYLNTGGADGFFFVKILEEKSDSYRIISSDGTLELQLPKTYIRPLIRSPKDCGQILIDSHKLEWGVFICDEIQKLNNPKDVVNFINWGESKQFHMASGCKNRSPWYKLPPQAKNGAPILIGRNHDKSHAVYYNPDLVVSNRFYRIIPQKGYPTKPLVAFLNTTLTWLQKELLGRTNLGQGALDTQGTDLSRILVPNRELIQQVNPEILMTFSGLASRKLLDVENELKTKDRIALDTQFLQLLGMESAKKEIYEAVIDLVISRQKKARSLENAE